MDRGIIYSALQAQPNFDWTAYYCRNAQREALPSVQKRIAELQQAAQQDENTPMPTLPYHLFREYWETGDRESYQKPYYERRGRLLDFALLTWLFPERTDYLVALEDVIWDICAEPFWCLPAHFLNVREEELPFEDYARQIDLFAAETGFALAETLQLCGGVLSERCHLQAEKQLCLRILDPFAEETHLFRFEKMTNNWSAVCGGAVGGVALLMERNEERLTALLHRALSCMEVYLSSFGADGVCVEGVNYWTYGFGFYVCFADLLRVRTGGALDLLKGEKAKAIACSYPQFFVAENRTLSFSDGMPHAEFRLGLCTYLQQRFPEMRLPDETYAMGILADRCHRFCLSLRDILWASPQAHFGFGMRPSVWLADAQWFLSRGRILAVAAKAGHNGESHNHNDCGSFVLYKNGVPLLEDVGASVYDAGTFGPLRYTRFENASRSHNVARINETEQRPGREATACDTAVHFGEKDEFTTELHRCYADETLLEYRRSLCHDRQAGMCTVCGHFTFTRPGTATEALLTHAALTLALGCATLSGGNQTLTISFDPALVTACVEEQKYIDHEGKEHTARQLLLSNRQPQTQFDILYTIQ